MDSENYGNDPWPPWSMFGITNLLKHRNIVSHLVSFKNIDVNNFFSVPVKSI